MAFCGFGSGVRCKNRRQPEEPSSPQSLPFFLVSVARARDAAILEVRSCASPEAKGSAAAVLVCRQARGHLIHVGLLCLIGARAIFLRCCLRYRKSLARASMANADARELARQLGSLE